MALILVATVPLHAQTVDSGTGPVPEVTSGSVDGLVAHWAVPVRLSRPMSISAALYGFGMDASGTLGLPFRQIASPSLRFTWNYFTSRAFLDADDFLSLEAYADGEMYLWEFSGGLGLSRAFPLGSLLNANVAGYAGGFLSQQSFGVNGGTGRTSDPLLPGRQSNGFGFAVGADIEIGLALWQTIDLVLGLSYDRYVGYMDYLSVSLGTRSYTRAGAREYHGVARKGVFETEAQAPPGPHIRLLRSEVDSVFPALANYYRENSLGELEIANVSEFRLSDVRVTVGIPELSETFVTVGIEEDLEPGESMVVPARVALSEAVLSVRERREAVAVVAVDYGILEFQQREEATVAVEIEGRNAIRWDDPRKVAAFMSVRDEEFKRVSNRAIGLTRPLVRPGIDQNLQQAMVVMEAMRSLEVAYVVDSTLGYERASLDAQAVDEVQYPRQTLFYRGGDSDDLAIAYTSLVESLGIETGYITVPGHMMAAVRLTSDYATAVRSLGDPQQIIDGGDGSGWIAVDVSRVAEGFTAAWESGAEIWARNEASGEAQLLRTREAWAVYPPVTGDPGIDPREVGADRLVEGFSSEVAILAQSQIAEREAQFEERLRRNPSDRRTANRLAILYASFGMNDEAIASFRALAEDGYRPARVNLGNIYLLTGEIESALQAFDEALADDPRNAAALVGKAQAHYELGQYRESTVSFASAASVDEGVSDRFAHLGSASSSTRAFSAFGQLVVEWEGE